MINEPILDEPRDNDGQDGDQGSAIEEDKNPPDFDNAQGQAQALPDLDQGSQVSQHSSPTSNSGGHFAMPMGASACSMAKNNLQQYPTSVQSYRSSPVLYDSANQGSNPRPLNTAAQSLPGSVGQSPARSVSVDEAASAALAHLLEIDEENRNPSLSSRRVYQHALSVRVPPAGSNPNQSNGAIPRSGRNSRKTPQNSDKTEENKD